MTAQVRFVRFAKGLFTRIEAAGGMAWFASAACALAWANSPWAGSYFGLWEQRLTIEIPGMWVSKSMQQWINDGPMVVFFFMLGLKIKREFLFGKRASLRQSVLPIVAAIGGVIVGGLFFTADLSADALTLGLGVLAMLVLCNSAGIRHPAAYLLVGVVLWLTTLASGVHPTVAGVLIAMAIPARPRIDEGEFIERANVAMTEFELASGPERTALSNVRRSDALHLLERVADEVQSPLVTMETSLHGLVVFGIMPLFVLANAGLALRGGTRDPLSWTFVAGIALVLLIGRSVATAVASPATVIEGVASASGDMTSRRQHRINWFGGIGFTVSLFIAGLSFDGGLLTDSAKLGVLVGSVLAGAVGWILPRRAPLGIEPEAIVIPFPVSSGPAGGR